MRPPRNNPAEVFEKYRRQLGAFIARRVPSPDEAEDILQEVFLRYVQTDALNPVAQVAAWLFRTARNRIIDYGRKHRECAFPQVDEEKGVVSEITALLSDDDRSPEMEFLRAMVWEALHGSVPARGLAVGERWRAPHCAGRRCRTMHRMPFL